VLGAQGVVHRILKEKLMLYTLGGNGEFRSDNNRVVEIVGILKNRSDDLYNTGKKHLLFKEFRELLDKMELSLNTRPLISTTGVPSGVTPYMLAYNLGPGHLFDSAYPNRNCSPSQTDEIRKRFLDQY
jgi:hypothetical protein